MNTSELIELLKEFEEREGGPVPVHVKVRTNQFMNDRFELDEYEVELDVNDAGTAVLIDLS